MHRLSCPGTGWRQTPRRLWPSGIGDPAEEHPQAGGDELPGAWQGPRCRSAGDAAVGTWLLRGSRVRPRVSRLQIPLSTREKQFPPSGELGLVLATAWTWVSRDSESFEVLFETTFPRRPRGDGKLYRPMSGRGFWSRKMRSQW